MAAQRVANSGLSGLAVPSNRRALARSLMSGGDAGGGAGLVGLLP